MPTKIEKDQVTGTETTGHDWDGIKELNTPLPRWWLWLFYATVIWSIGYFIAYPAIPFLNSHTEGVLGYDSREEIAEVMAEVADSRGPLLDRIEAATLEEIRSDSELLSFSLAASGSVFGENCAPCHGQGGAGASGYPALVDDDWIWGGNLEEILFTLRHGIRATDPETRFSEMPAFAGLFARGESQALSGYVLSLSGLPGDGDLDLGAQLYADNCAVCHAEDGQGDQALGAPNLADAIWFYGSTQAEIIEQINAPRHGVMPAWGERLDENTLKMLTVYVHSLGGGE